MSNGEEKKSDLGQVPDDAAKDSVPSDSIPSESVPSDGEEQLQNEREERRHVLRLPAQPGLARIVLELDTALFMRGGPGQRLPEFRPAAIRGAMRYWFRAVASGIAPLTEVWRLESEVFGASGIPGIFRLRVGRTGRRPRIVSSKHLLPHKENQKAKENASAFAAGGSFELVLSPLQPFKFDRPRYEIALWSLWLALHLGGFGPRSRRGAGSFHIVRAVGTPPGFVADAPLSTLAEYRSYLECGLERARALIRTLVTSDPEVAQKAPTNPLIAESTQIVLAHLGEGDEEKIRADLMLKMREFKNPVFGLPLRLEGNWVRPNNSRIHRFASPVVIRLLKLGNGWVSVITAFSHRPEAPGVDGIKIDQFLHSLGTLERVAVK